MEIAKSKGKSAAAGTYSHSKDCYQDMGNALNIITYLGYNLMIVILWASVDTEGKRNSLFLLQNAFPWYTLCALSKQTLIVIFKVT